MPKIATNRIPATLPSRPDAAPVTIGGLARAAEVGVETVRYYQRRHLLAVPHSGAGVRRYPAGMIDRIRFIKRSQNLGFSLDEIRELMRLVSKIIGSTNACATRIRSNGSRCSNGNSATLAACSPDSARRLNPAGSIPSRT